MHNTLETSDTTEEDRTIKTLDVYAIADFFRNIFLVFPWAFLVECVESLSAIAVFYEVASTLHEENASDYHTDSHSGEQVNKYSHEEYHHHNESVRLWNAEDILKSTEVDDAPSYGDKDTGKN